jgi:hypothetical protein
MCLSMYFIKNFIKRKRVITMLLRENSRSSKLHNYKASGKLSTESVPKEQNRKERTTTQPNKPKTQINDPNIYSCSKNGIVVMIVYG